MTNKRNLGAVSVLVAVAMAMGLHASAQETPQTHVSGTFNDYVWVEAGAGAGAWHVTGEWTARVKGQRAARATTGSLLGVRSDLWVLETSGGPC